MKMIKRMTALAVITGAALAATPAAAVPVTGAKPQAKVTILKPLVLTRTGNLDFGTILMSNVTGPTSVSMNQTGAVTCGTGLTCGGATTVGGYNVKGTNNQVVLITAPNVVMANSTNPGNNITVTLSAPANVNLTNSGNAGANFAVGGSFTITPTTVDGVYAGDMEVTVDYQ